MCILNISYKTHPDYKMIIAANRDEFYSRPTAKASFWENHPLLLAGKDLHAGGTWLGITKSGKFSAITNYRSTAEYKKDAPSRGKLVSDFLAGTDNPKAYADKLMKTGHIYNGFNLLFSDQSELYYFSNHTRESAMLPPGIYGLSNHLLNAPWPKVEKSKLLFTKALMNKNVSESELFEILLDTSKPPDEELPDTGVGLELERVLSSVFVATPIYGTVSSTLIFISNKDEVRFIEKSLNSGSKEWTTTEFNFILDR